AELFRYNGTSASLITDLYPGSTTSNPNSLTIFNNDLYFRANDGTHGEELFKYDGTSVSLVKDINPGAAGSEGDTGPIGVTAMAVYNNALYMKAKESGNNVELYKYDGTNVSLVSDIYPGSIGSGPTDFIVYNNALYFAANYPSAAVELMKYDGTSVSMVSD